jgi:hypothetical protein
MMRTFLTGCLFWLTTALTAEAASLYVDGNLAATCSGTTYSVATRTCTGASGAGFKTIPEGLRALHASDTLFIRGGTYTYGGVTYGNASTDTYGCNPTCPVSWAGATRVTNFPGETIIIRGLYFNMDNDTYRNGLSYFVMEGETRSRFILEPNGTNCPDATTCPGTNDAPLRVNNAVHHIRFNKLTVRNWQQFSFSGGNSSQCTKKPTFIELLDSEWRNNGNGVDVAGDPIGTRQEHAIYPSCGDDWLIQRNYIVGSYGYGIHINSSNALNNATALNRFTVIDNIIEGRRSTTAMTTAGIVITRGTGHIVRNNLVMGQGSQAGQHKYGIVVGVDISPASSSIVENNTVYGVLEACFQNFRANNVEYRNNLCNGVPTNKSFDMIAPSSNVTFQTNLCPTENAEAGIGCSVINPIAGFMSAGTNFRLAAGSPAIDSGTTTSLTSDIEGRTRALGKAFDIGAYEFGTNSILSPPRNLKVQ